MMKRLFTKEGREQNKEEMKKAVILLIAGAILIPIAIPIAIFMLKFVIAIVLFVGALYLAGKAIIVGAKMLIDNKTTKAEEVVDNNEEN